MVEQNKSQEQERPLARAYHWTPAEKVFDIKYGHNLLVFDSSGRKTTNEPGIYPLRELVNGKSYIFSFLGSPLPSGWKKYPDITRALFKRFGGNPQLLSFDVYENDNAQVADLGTVVDYFIEEGFRTGFGNPVVWKYINSFVPLSDYKGQYELAELLIPEPVPVSRPINFPDGSKIIRNLRG